MNRWLRRLVLGALVLLLVPAQGCSLALLTVTIPDFASKAVAGVWIWRLSPTTGAFERDTQFTFQGTRIAANGEILDYQATATSDGRTIPATAYVLRDPVNRDQVTLQLILSKVDETGYYRASTFNANGDSPLSLETLSL